MNIKVNTDYSETDEIINSIDNLLNENGFETEINKLTISFYRKTDKRPDRLMPIKEVIKGISSGKLKVQKTGDSVLINCKFQWFLHSFTTILLIGAFFFILYTINDFNYALDKLLIGSVIVLPLSITGIFVSKKYFKNIVIKAVRQTGIGKELIESS